MRYLFPIILLAFFSCKTVKFVEKEKTVMDSTAVEQNELLQKTLHETIERYEKQIEEINKTGIVFDTVRSNDTVFVNKIVFDNGKIKSAEGRIRSVSQDLVEKSSELYDAHRIIDSLTSENERKDTQLSKKQETLVKEVRKTVWPWWIFIICLLAGLIIEYLFKPINKILSTMRFMKLLLPFTVLFLFGCSHFRSDPTVSVWSEGLWLIFWIPFLGSLWLFYRSYLASKSGWTKRDKETGRLTEGSKLPIYKTGGKFWFAVVLQVFAWAVVWYVNSDYWK